MEDLGTMVKTLKIADSTHERLKKYGQFGDSFDKLLNRLMDIADGNVKDFLENISHVTIDWDRKESMIKEGKTKK